MLKIIFIIIYLIGIIPTYIISRKELRKAAKENYSYSDVIMNIFISSISWIGFFAILFDSLPTNKKCIPTKFL